MGTIATFCHRGADDKRIALSMSSASKVGTFDGSVHRCYLQLAIDDSAAEMPFSENV